MVDHVSIHSSEMKGTMRVQISVYFLLELNRRIIARQRIPFSQVPPSNKSVQPAKQQHKPSLINPILILLNTQQIPSTIQLRNMLQLNLPQLCMN